MFWQGTQQQQQHPHHQQQPPLALLAQACSRIGGGGAPGDESNPEGSQPQVIQATDLVCSGGQYIQLAAAPQDSKVVTLLNQMLQGSAAPQMIATPVTGPGGTVAYNLIPSNVPQFQTMTMLGSDGEQQTVLVPTSSAGLAQTMQFPTQQGAQATIIASCGQMVRPASVSPQQANAFSLQTAFPVGGFSPGGSVIQLGPPRPSVLQAVQMPQQTMQTVPMQIQVPTANGQTIMQTVQVPLQSLQQATPIPQQQPQQQATFTLTAGGLLQPSDCTEEKSGGSNAGCVTVASLPQSICSPAPLMQGGVSSILLPNGQIVQAVQPQQQPSQPLQALGPNGQILAGPLLSPISLQPRHSVQLQAVASSPTQQQLGGATIFSNASPANATIFGNAQPLLQAVAVTPTGQQATGKHASKLTILLQGSLQNLYRTIYKF